MKSIISNKKECFVCQTPFNLHKHHCLYGAGNRKLSEKYGLWIFLCARHHNMSDEGVHFNGQLDSEIKRMSQQKWEEIYGSREDFIKTFGKSYL